MAVFGCGRERETSTPSSLVHEAGYSSNSVKYPDVEMWSALRMRRLSLQPLPGIHFDASISHGYSYHSSHHQDPTIRIYGILKKDFIYYENIHGQITNVLQGLELHTGIFNEMEQKTIVNFVYYLQCLGQNGELNERTYSQPKKWMPGKGRVTIHFGCCYNYALDKKGNKPGIMRDEEVDSIPPILQSMIQRMVNWSVLPTTCVPDSCIVNIYDKGDCIPPHIDHHDFRRPFCTVSFLSECDILFGPKIEVIGPGKFSGPVAIPLPKGSVLVFKGNGADVSKHCIPSVPGKRISITFRKMDDSKLPYSFAFNPMFRETQPLMNIDTYRSRQNRLGNDGKDDDDEFLIRPKKRVQRYKSGIIVSETIYV
ncbi:hypothetical protein MKW98_011389 [Papaver atlanticum]|uniref:Fe2OG dioxygenase domain-containing protein n=1 Tax=Papaver atlanticum TaxID=357466 RepID=A0AAD4SVG8_9MAGN|nr:hypothetical protein MKW98_011389 [Papaver atlanticum]